MTPRDSSTAAGKDRKAAQAAKRKVWVIDPRKMKIGDILLATDDGPISQLGRALTEGQYTHAALCTRTGLLTEAALTSVRHHSVMRLLSDRREYICVLRLKEGVKKPDDIAKNAAQYAERKLDGLYWLKGSAAVSKGTPPPPAPAGAYFCSQLVAEAYREAGCDLLPGRDPARTQPDDLLRSGLLEDVSDDVLIKEDEEAARALVPSLRAYPHLTIEQEEHRKMLRSKEVRSIFTKSGRPAPHFYAEARELLEQTQDGELDAIMAETVETIRRKLEAVEFADNPIPLSEVGRHYLFAGSVQGGYRRVMRLTRLAAMDIDAVLGILDRMCFVLESDIEDRKQEAARNEQRARRASGVETWKRQFALSRLLLKRTESQLAAVKTQASLLRQLHSLTIRIGKIAGG